jgi:cyanate permease
MTALQTSVPDGRYGRVVTAVDTLALTAVPLGSAAAVPLVAGLGLRPALLLISAAYLAVVAACAWTPAFRMMDEKLESRKLTAIDNV